MNETSSLKKVVFMLEDESWHGYGSESLWATHISNDVYRIENSPFLVKGVSYRDKIKIKATDNILYFEQIVMQSGHSTYRIILNDGYDHSDFLEFWHSLNDQTCTWEHGDFLSLPIYAIDVPPQSDIDQIYPMLEKGEADGLWDFEESNYSKLNH